MYQMILKNQQSATTNLTKETSAFKKGLKSVKQALSKKKSAPHKTRSTPERVTIEIKDFDASVFERLMRYIHCGVVAVDPMTVIGKGVYNCRLCIITILYYNQADNIVQKAT